MTTEEESRIIEVSGVKMEIDLRHAKVVEKYRVGDGVKVLVKKYTDTFESYPGVIIGFDAFVQRPTIIIAYLEASYSAAEIKIVHLNSSSPDVEIVPVTVGEFMLSERCRVEELLDRGILKAEQALEAEIAKKTYFQKYFGMLFEDIPGEER